MKRYAVPFTSFLIALAGHAQETSMTLRDYAERDPRPIETLTVKKVGDAQLILMICKPDGWAAGQRRTGVIWVHGGGWVAGHPKMFAPHMRYTASRGAVAFAVQYRLMNSSNYRDDKKLSKTENAKLRTAKFKAFIKGPALSDCIADCMDAVRYIRRHAVQVGVDPSRLVAAGDSSGSHLAACLGTLAPADARVQAVIACSSISDLTYRFGREAIKPSPGFEGKEMEADPARLRRAKAASPYHNITKDTAAFLILHGQNDWLKDEPKRFYNALKAAGVDCEYKVYPTAKHAFIVYGYSATLSETTQALLDMDAFLVKRGFLKGQPTIRMPGTAAKFIRQPTRDLPTPTTKIPTPPIAPPAGSKCLCFDNHCNFWALAPAKEKGLWNIVVLPAQKQEAWETDELGGLGPGRWSGLIADDRDHIWVTDGTTLYRLYPKHPRWEQMSADSAFPQGRITTLAVSPFGGAAVALNTGLVVEIDRGDPGRNQALRNRLSITPAPKNIRTMQVDIDGALWVKSGNVCYKRAPAPDAWQKHWQVVSYMPGGCHDLSGSVLDGVFYMSWAITGDFGYPSKGAFHRHLLAFDAATRSWRKAADFGLPRGYGGTGILNGKVWSVGGDAQDKDGRRFTTTMTQIFDPVTGKLTSGPALPAEIPSTLCLNSGDRLYALGFVKGNESRLKLYSIGKGETAWTTEPEGPIGNGASYGCAVDGKLYTVVAHRYLAIFDTTTRTWATSVAPHSPRSAAVGHFKGEVWTISGRTGEGGMVTYIYTPSTQSWRKGPAPPREVVWGCAFNIGGALYLTGGAGTSPSSYNHRTYRLRQR